MNHKIFTFLRLPLKLKGAVENPLGKFSIKSEVEKGTPVSMTFLNYAIHQDQALVLNFNKASSLLESRAFPDCTNLATSPRMEGIIMMQRKATAIWQGGLKNGTGTISTTSKVLSNTVYSFATRFDNASGTNPEELIAAAHAACFSMALSAELEKQEIQSTSITTIATATLELLNEGWRVTKIHLDIVANIPNINNVFFQDVANNAKLNCPISQLLNAKITMNAKLEQKAA